MGVCPLNCQAENRVKFQQISTIFPPAVVLNVAMQPVVDFGHPSRHLCTVLTCRNVCCSFELCQVCAETKTFAASNSLLHCQLPLLSVMGLAIVKTPVPPGPKTGVLEPLRHLGKFVPHMHTSIHQGHSEAASAALCMCFFAAGLEKRKRKKRQTRLPKQLGESGNF